MSSEAPGTVAGSAASSSQPPTLAPDRSAELSSLIFSTHQPLQTASRLALLAALCTTYRDLWVAMDRLHKLQSLGTDQLSRSQSLAPPDTAPLGAAASAGALQTTTSTARPVLRFPIRDVTTLPDSVSPSGLRLDAQYMDKISCWMQLMPSHMEVSYQLLQGVQLFPPMEACYPTYIDFDAAMRMLDLHRSRRRMNRSRRWMQRQDKYQIKTWDHYPGAG
ncbi:MAG: hypothetical protein WDW38_001774 [Sanguina aurantia]